jgi:hypothetical protein
MEDPDHGSRTVQLDVLRSGEDLVRVSTAFLMGINHRLMDGTDPLLFETMVFGGTMDHAQWRYPTWEQAETGHEEVLLQLLREMPHLTRDRNQVMSPRETYPTRYSRIIRDLSTRS